MSNPLLGYSRPTVDDDDIAAVTEALRSEFLTTGPRVEEFETTFAEATGAAHAVACNSGTAALHLAALALDLEPGTSAIVPSITFLATANAMRMVGCEVVFADVDPDTGLMTPDTFAAALGRADAAGAKVTVALPVHLNGQPCDMPGLSVLAGERGIALIEDACHALGIAGVGATTHSRLACFSTHAVKAITTAEGGVVTVAEAGLARRMRQLRTHGMTRTSSEFVHRHLAFDGADANPWYCEMQDIGWNYRLPDVLCALGISQLRKLEAFQRRRAEIASLYDRLLAPLAPAVRPAVRRTEAHGWHLYAVLIDFAALRTTRRKFMDQLRAAGVGSQVHYGPVHRQPYYWRRYGDSTLPGVDAYYARCLSIPMFPRMSDADVEHVARSLAAAVRQ